MAADFTVADVLAWARTKPAHKGYDSCSAQHCAIAQFGKATNRPELVGVGYLSTVLGRGDFLTVVMLSNSFGELVRGLEAVVEPSFIRRTWARLTGKTIGKLTFSVRPAYVISATWSQPDAYLTDIEQVEA